MTTEYFPFFSETLNADGVLTNVYDFNLRPGKAISNDPREIITEWTTSSLNTLTNEDIYPGLKIYCKADRLTRICLWRPDGGVFTGNDCVWDIISSEKTQNSQWIDVTTYEPTDIDETIKNNQLIQWEKMIKIDTSYWGYYILDTDYSNIDSSSYWTTERKSSLMNQLLSNKMLNSQGVEVSDVSGSYNKLKTKNKTQTLAYNDSSKNFKYIEGANLVLFVPVNRSDGSGRQVSVSYIDSSSTEITFDHKITRVNVNGVDFDLYIINHKITLDSDGTTLPKTSSGIQLKFTTEL